MDTTDFIWDREVDPSITSYRSILGYNQNPLTSTNPLGWVKSYADSQGLNFEQMGSKLQSLGYNPGSEWDNWARSQDSSFQSDFLNKIGLTDDQSKIDFINKKLVPGSKRPENVAAITQDKTIFAGATPITSSGGKSPLELTQSLQSSKYPQPGQTIGDLFTNPSDGITYNWRTGELINDPRKQAAPTARSTTQSTAPVVTLPQGTLLKEGTYNNSMVKTIQGLLGIVADGDFGPMTKNAVIAFQKANGLTPDGIIGPQTVAALNKKYGATSGTSGGATGGATASSTGAAGGTSMPVATSAQPRQEAKLAEIKAQLEQGTQQPELFNSVEEFDKLRKEQGIVKDEEELASIRNEARRASEELNQFKQTSGKEISQGGYLGGISEAERNLNFRMESLALREQAVLDRVNTKNAYISSVVKLGQQDYDTAKTVYDDEYNKNLKALQIYNEEINDQQADAFAGFQTMANLLSQSGMSTLTPELSSQMDTLALKAGLPSGIFQQALKGLSTNEKISNLKTIEGRLYMTTIDGAGVPHLKLVSGQPSASSSGGNTITDLNTVEASRVQEKLLANRGADGYVDPYYYGELRSASRLSATEFDKKFGYLVNPVSKQKFNVGTGVTGTNASIGEANLQGILDQYGASSIQQLLELPDVPIDVLYKIQALI